ncbi:MAG: acyl-CoA dehydrogenase family protein [Nocardioidaceae bacterium]
MSGFALEASDRQLVARVRELAERELRSLADAGAEGHVNRPLLARMGELGLLSQFFEPRSDAGPALAGSAAELGAGGGGSLRLCLLRETLASVTTEAETALALQALGSYPLVQAGRAVARARWLPGVVDGSVVAAYALSESGAGSDAAALDLAAQRVDGGWRLTGEKTWISNAPEADVYSVFARTGEPGPRGITGFVVAGDSDGLKGEHLDLLSPHPIGRIVFDGVFVSDQDVLGEVGGGFAVAMAALDLVRPSVGAFAVGMGQSALDAAVSHAKTRQAFGGPLHEQQAVSHLLAEMATRLQAARLLVYAAATSYDAGAPRSEITRNSAMAKLFATETAQFVVDSAVQIHGARALQRGHLLEHLYREVRAPRIYEGASEVQRTIIGRSLTR